MPEVLPGGAALLAAFWELSTDRHIGMSAGPIPASAIARWAQRHGYGIDDEIELRFYIRAMDRVFCSNLRHRSSAPEPEIGRPLTPRLFDALFSSRA